VNTKATDQPLFIRLKLTKEENGQRKQWEEKQCLVPFCTILIDTTLHSTTHVQLVSVFPYMTQLLTANAIYHNKKHVACGYWMKQNHSWTTCTFCIHSIWNSNAHTVINFYQSFQTGITSDKSHSCGSQALQYEWRLNMYNVDLITTQVRNEQTDTQHQIYSHT